MTGSTHIRRSCTVSTVKNSQAAGEERVRVAYAPEIYYRLVRLKDEYDPDNLFRLNQNIRPSAQ
jgi:FAD/FMN-containing dehydrogenase